MKNLDSIFDTLDSGGYTQHIDKLATDLQQAGITDYEEFMRLARSQHISVDKTIQAQLPSLLSNTDDEDWQKAVEANTHEAYQQYIDDHRENGKYVNEAREKISQMLAASSPNKPDLTNPSDSAPVDNYTMDDLVEEINSIRTKSLNPEQDIHDTIIDYIQSNYITVNELYDKIRDDFNFISGTVAKQLIKENVINTKNLAGIVGEDFVKYMKNEEKTKETFSDPPKLTEICKSPSTEVYFWGIPSSGKSCALGAILRAANSGRDGMAMHPDPDCQAYGYMTKLAHLFDPKGKIGTLPAGTAVTSTYEMGFKLVKEKKEHPITCIDLAGELVRCMHKFLAGDTLRNTERDVLQTLTDILQDNRTDNRKFHFFVLEYGAEDRKYEGLNQDTYLTSAVAYINRTGIFKKNTDGLYLLITKADKAKVKGKELNEKLKAYIIDNYNGLYTSLVDLCARNEINRGRVDIYPFSLGTVCFQNYCKFNPETAHIIVDLLLERSYAYKLGKLEKLYRQMEE